MTRPIALRNGTSGSADTILFGSDKALVRNDIAGLSFIALMSVA